ncbi:MAG: NAD(P)-dependent alcohol dehydrogenase [Chitinophagaceae bacterium]|nr:NAD(P)-dependent alcohol dehydrogenase [Chitinophagaceae bacterium]
MKAIVYTKYGSPDVLQLKEVDKPTPKENEVLIKVVASSVNEWDNGLISGKGLLTRLLGGLFKPKNKILGADVAGVIEAVGANIKKFKSGDEVFGDIAGAGFGAFAEYVCAPEKMLAKKSQKMSFEQAAALPQAGLLALQGLRYKKPLKAGQHLLINGAGGGVGPIALQYAKSIGATVTCVDREEKFEMLHSLGADELIDYSKTDYTKTGNQYDYILDVTACRSVGDYKRALKPDGVFVMIGGSMGWLIVQMMLIQPLLFKFSNKKLGIMGYRVNTEGLNELSSLFEEGKVSPVIDKSFPLAETANAFRYYEKGTFTGKIVIAINSNAGK